MNRFKLYPSSLGWGIVDNFKHDIVINYYDKLIAECFCEALNTWNERVDGSFACDKAYDNGYDNGFANGEEYGREHGYDEGYSDGYNDCKQEEY